MKLLAIDTATEACSAAIFVDGAVTSRHEELGRGHGDRILSMVDELLHASALTLRELDAIAFGRGPGGFTGVRLATSLAQGLGFAAGLPLVPVSDLRAVAQQAFDELTNTQRVVVCNDARMGEVYWACFIRGPGEPGGLACLVGAEAVGPPESVHLPPGWPGCDVLAGRGAAVFPQLQHALPHEHAALRLLPHAAAIATLGAADFAAGLAVEPRDAAPVYVRDNVARPT